MRASISSLRAAARESLRPFFRYWTREEACALGITISRDFIPLPS